MRGDVGQAVRYLRLDGGLGKELYQIALHIPRLHTIFVNLAIKSSDSIAGFKKALLLLSPVHLYVDKPRQSRMRENKNTQDARASLCTVLKEAWPSLVGFTFILTENMVNNSVVSGRLLCRTQSTF